MQKLLMFVAACLISCAMAFGQSAPTDPSPTQPGGSTASASPSNSGNPSSTRQTAADRTPSSRDQELPGGTNPSNSTRNDGSANGRAVRPSQPDNSVSGAVRDRATGGSNGDNSVGRKDDSSSSPAGRDANTATDTRAAAGLPWVWIALGIVVGVILVGALFNRSRAAGEVDRFAEGGVRSTRERHEIEIERRDDDQIRRAG